MGLPRSTFYDAPTAALDDTGIVGRMRMICDEFETYGRDHASRMAGPSGCADRLKGASIIPIAGRNTHRKSTVSCLPIMASSGQ